MTSQVVDIDAFLRNEGFADPIARDRARAVLEAVGLTRPGKRGMAGEKRTAAQAALSGRLLRICGKGECAAMAARDGAGEREAVIVSPPACEVCGGSNNRRAAWRSLTACRWRALPGCSWWAVRHAPRRTGPLLAPHGLSSLRGRRHRLALAPDAVPNIQWAGVIWGHLALPPGLAPLHRGAAPGHLRVVVRSAAASKPCRSAAELRETDRELLARCRLPPRLAGIMPPGGPCRG
ncbi:MAG: hypothetical protein U0531_15420 [Dehalococcoidia bacterium]